jgi:hypothetical protein
MAGLAGIIALSRGLCIFPVNSDNGASGPFCRNVGPAEQNALLSR